MSKAQAQKGERRPIAVINLQPPDQHLLLVVFVFSPRMRFDNMTSKHNGLFSVLATAAILAFHTPALAASGMYAGANIGASLLSDLTSTNAFGSTETNTNTGLAVTGVVGYQFPSLPVRAELELGYTRNSVNQEKVDGISVDANGHASAWSGLVNVLYDIPTGTRFSPYIGAGAGVSRITADVSTDSLLLTDVNDSATVFTYQGKAGVAYALTDSLSLDVGYTYRKSQDPEFVDSAGIDFKSEYQTHLLTAGLRYRF